MNVSIFVYCKNGDAKGDVHESAGHERGDMKRWDRDYENSTQAVECSL